VKKPLSSGSPDLILTYGADVYSFRASIDSRYQLPSSTAQSWDPKTQAMLEGKSSEPTLSGIGNLSGKKLAGVMGLSDNESQTAAPLETSELKAWSDAQIIKSRLSALKGVLKFQGNHKPLPNTLIELAGFGKRFNGNALISGVSHQIEAGNWTTTVRLGLSREWHAERVAVDTPLNGGLLPAVRGLQIGTVKQIHEDPDSAFRIQLTIPTIDAGESEIWARMASIYATKGQGVFFYPEVGDEVILGFLNNDPRYAVVLGMLYSEKQKPPYTADEKNKTKAIVTKSDLKIEFDDEDKILTISTPGGNEVVLSDKDKQILIKDMNGNKAALSEKGITLDSASDLVLKAKGKVSVSANHNIEMKSSGGDVSLEGLNVNAKAQMSFEASASASSKLTSSGQVTVQGAMVKIN